MKTLIIARLFYVILFSTLFQRSVKATDSSISCQQVNATVIPAYTHWPFRVDCSHLEEVWLNSPNATAADEFQCNVSSAAVEHGPDIFEVTTADSIHYRTKLIINGSSCLSGDVIVNVQAFPQGTCPELVDEAGRRGEITSRQATIDDYVELRCIPPEGTPTLIPEGVNRKLFTTSWHTKCEEKNYRSNNLWKDVPDPEGYPDKLSMPRVDFYDATNFTCNVTYGGRSLYPVTYAQCIKQALDLKDPTVACTRTETEPSGGLAQLDCAVQVVNGLTPSDSFVAEWMQDGKVICRNHFFNRISPGLLNSRTSCIVEGRNETLPCIEDGESKDDEEIPRSRKKLEMKLNISNLQGDDFGDYSVEVRVRNENGGWLRDERHPITVNEDKTPFYEKVVIGLSSAFAVIVFSVMAGLLIWRFRIYILLAYKRSVLWKYDKDDNKEWVAYLSYYFDGSPETESAKKNSEATKKIVCGIHKVMEKLEYRYYDEQREGDFSVAVEKITNLVDKCHRMILVLTPEYLDDKWRRFHAELGWHGLFESHIGLVFVLTPGVKRILKKRAAKDSVWRKLVLALKTNRVINWTHSMSEDELMRHIEYAMPKLRRTESLLPVSGDSTNLAGNGLQIPAYNRSMSQTTACTILTPDTPPADINNFV